MLIRINNLNLLLYIFINLFQIIINQDSLKVNNLDLNYTHTLSLSNGNIFIIHKNGVNVYNYNFTIKLYDFDFGGNLLIPSETDNDLTSIIQSKDDINKYVIAIINNIIYVFTSKGQYYFHFSHTLLSDFSTNVLYKYYSFLYYKYNDNTYYYILSFINNDNAIKLIEFEIYMNNHSYKITRERAYQISDNISDTVSCQIINKNSTKMLGCFYLITTYYKITVSLFDIEDNFQIKDSENITFIIQGNHHLIKSVMGKEEGKVLVNIMNSEMPTSGWFGFDFNSFQYQDNIGYSIECLQGTKLINLYYFEYVEQYVLSCYKNEAISFGIINYTEDIKYLSCTKINQITYKNCTDFINFDIIFLIYEGKFNIVKNFICSETTTQIYNFPSILIDLTKYEKPSDDPDNEYLFSEVEKTFPISTIPSPITSSIINPTTSPILSPSTFPLISTILTVIPSTTNKIETKNKCKLKCLECDENSSILDLCIKCNTDNKFYPSIAYGLNYLECFNEETKPTNYFFNQISEYYEPCHSNCKTCLYQGNGEINNCTSCKNNYIFRPDKKDTSNCVIKCEYYYYVLFNNYFCTNNNQCPVDSPLLIRDKGRCIDNCYNDDDYKYQFNYECYKECPEETIVDNNYICRIVNKKKCYLYTDFFSNVNFKNLETNHFDVYIKRYINGFEDTDFHLDFYQSKNYTITIYKTMECLKELKMNSTIIDFRECYQKVQEKYNFIGRNLIILIADFFNDKKLNNTLFYFFNPDTGEQLQIEEICQDINITIEKSLTYYPEINIENAKFFENQDINIFNSEDVFYNDLCYSFESPNGKDVPLKERILIFYPNVTLCDNNCKNVGVNLTTLKAICECKFKELLGEGKDAAKLVGLDFTEVLSSLSLDVLKCYKTLFKGKNFIKCYGGLLSLLLIIFQTICLILLLKRGIYIIRKTSFSLIEMFSIILDSKKEIQFQPKKNFISNVTYSHENLNLNCESKNKVNLIKLNNNLDTHKEENIEIKDSGKVKLIRIKKKKPRKRLKKKFKSINTNKNLDISTFKLNNEIYLKDYLKTSMDELDYDDLIEKDHRGLIRIFIDKLITSQLIIDLFFNRNWIIPKTIKVIFLIVMIDLYMVVNDLFYNEDYIVDLYYLDKKETLFSFVPRSLNIPIIINK